MLYLPKMILGYLCQKKCDSERRSRELILDKWIKKNTS